MLPLSGLELKGFLLRRRGPEYVVPERGTHSETLIGAFKVMLHVIELDEFEIFSFDLEVMSPVMRQIIDEVSGDKSGKCGCEPMGGSDQFRPHEKKEAIKE
jgi:hypothetical protein